MPPVTLFHTSDMHNKLTPDLAQRLHDLKAEHPDSLMLDSGDAIWSGNIYWRPGGEPILDLMSSVPYDAMCMGNREFHFLSAGLMTKTSRAKFPVLSANLRPANPLPLEGRAGEGSSCGRGEGPPPNPLHLGGGTSGSLPSEGKVGVGSFMVLERAGIRTAIFGLSVPCVTERMMMKKVSDHYFVQPIEAAREIVPVLRKECDLLIAVTHIGIKQDRELAEIVPGIDVILGGHTHTVTDEPERVVETLILHSGMYAHCVRRVEIEVDGGEVSVKSELVPLGKA